MLVNLYDQQGKCERIKNTPYPRQFGSVDTYFVWLLIVILPLGLLNEFNKLGAGYVWLTIPCSTIVGWVFATMERIGQASENPFEGSPNDTPMFALSRTIEIDMRDMLDDPELPSAITATNNILM